jgi:hypothetical protein
MFFTRLSARLKPQTRRSQSWLLLWVLPYLLFSVAGEGLHNHGLGLRDTPCAAHQSHSQACGPTSALPEQVAFHASCVTCQWSAHSATLFNLPETTPLQRALATPPAPNPSVPSLVLLHRRGIRGPPLW